MDNVNSARLVQKTYYRPILSLPHYLLQAYNKSKLFRILTVVLSLYAFYRFYRRIKAAFQESSKINELNISLRKRKQIQTTTTITTTARSTTTTTIQNDTKQIVIARGNSVCNNNNNKNNTNNKNDKNTCAANNRNSKTRNSFENILESQTRDSTGDVSQDTLNSCKMGKFGTKAKKSYDLRDLAGDSDCENENNSNNSSNSADGTTGHMGDSEIGETVCNASIVFVEPVVDSDETLNQRSESNDKENECNTCETCDPSNTFNKYDNMPQSESNNMLKSVDSVVSNDTSNSNNSDSSVDCINISNENNKNIETNETNEENTNNSNHGKEANQEERSNKLVLNSAELLVSPEMSGHSGPSGLTSPLSDKNASITEEINETTEAADDAYVEIDDSNVINENYNNSEESVQKESSNQSENSDNYSKDGKDEFVKIEDINDLDTSQIIANEDTCTNTLDKEDTQAETITNAAKDETTVKTEENSTSNTNNANNTQNTKNSKTKRAKPKKRGKFVSVRSVLTPNNDEIYDRDDTLGLWNILGHNRNYFDICVHLYPWEILCLQRLSMQFYQRFNYLYFEQIFWNVNNNAKAAQYEYFMIQECYKHVISTYLELDNDKNGISLSYSMYSTLNRYERRLFSYFCIFYDQIVLHFDSINSNILGSGLPQGINKLQRLDLRWNQANFKPFGLNAICGILQHQRCNNSNHIINEIDLTFNELDNSDLYSIFSALMNGTRSDNNGNCNNVKRLILARNDIDDECMNCLFNQIIGVKCQNIEYLDLSETAVSDETCQIIYDCFKNNRNDTNDGNNHTNNISLKEIKLIGSQKITGKGISTLNRLFKQNIIDKDENIKFICHFCPGIRKKRNKIKLDPRIEV